MQQTRTRIETVLSQYQDPYLGTDLASAGALSGVREEGDRVVVSLTLGYPCTDIRAAMSTELELRIKAETGLDAKVDILQDNDA
jgi:ATP-binding protein involved in chromosome partitioning